MNPIKDILVAEDNADDIFLLKRVFGRCRLQARLQFVCNGEEVLAYLRGEGAFSNRQRFPFPDLVLLDIKMPKKTGLDVLREVRCDRRLKRLIMIVLTSSEEPSDINTAYYFNVNSYLIKSGDTCFLEQMFHKLDEYWLELNQRPTCPNPN